MKRLYIITGANGHLGSTIVRELLKRKEDVRGLVLKSERQDVKSNDNVTYMSGDVRDKSTLDCLFDNTVDREVVVIHAAGIIDITKQASHNMYDVNVNGTKNMIELSINNNVHRFVYVSSVHAIPETETEQEVKESESFSPQKVNGGYAKTKAQATQLVLDAVKRGLNAVVVHPSGIIGPFDDGSNHLVQMVKNYITGKLPACVKGGYDFVDVRDVADGCLSAVEKGKIGECYILSNQHYEIKEVLGIIKGMVGGKKLSVLPMWLAKTTAPFFEWSAKVNKQKPLYTKYSLYTLNSKDRFSHSKASQELDYNPRDLKNTVVDTVKWLCNGLGLMHKRVKRRSQIAIH